MTNSFFKSKLSDIFNLKKLGSSVRSDFDSFKKEKRELDILNLLFKSLFKLLTVGWKSGLLLMTISKYWFKKSSSTPKPVPSE